MKTNICNKFGAKIRQLRLDEGWSQEKLAELTEFHRTYIGMVERGERNPSLRNIERFAKAYRLEIKDLF